MEASSPLAAMQPPSFGMPSWGRGEMFPSHPHAHMSDLNSCGPGAFNFRDISMMASSPDYFNGKKPIRGSSPTASLAADLSQNFHIDMSPQLPTPRRCLFTSNLFGRFDGGREAVTTPPLSSSSPCLEEQMDMSPLPHKPAFFSQHMEIDSPTPQPQHTSSQEITKASSPPRRSSAEATKSTTHHERKKSGLLRPSLARSKGLSANAVPSRGHPDAPPFRFGAVSSKLSTTSMTLEDCFCDPPTDDRRPQSANSPLSAMMGSPRQKLGLSNANNDSMRCNGSPINHSRRTSNPLLRPRKQFRRSLSMFESPVDIVQGKKEATMLQPSALEAVIDMEEAHIPQLPHFFQEGQSDSIPRISKETLLEVLDGKFDHDYDQRMVIDCRFEYEFEGGHINGAVNYNDKELVTSQLFETSLPGKTLLIFHCEYSAHRAPIMARHVRQQDRTTNIEQYPKLTYPEVYILEGGYSLFFSEHRDRCYPQNYVEMDAKEHAYTREREMGRLRQNRAKIGRAQTYAFEQLEDQQMDDSPTAFNARPGDDEMIDSSPMSGDRGNARRMVSF